MSETPEQNLQDARRPSAGVRPWVFSGLALLLFDLLFIGPALFTDDMRAPWDPLFLRQPVAAEFPEAVNVDRSALRTDWTRQFQPWSVQVRDAWLAGHVPLWDQYAGLGKPLLGNCQSEAFSPYQPINLVAGSQFWDWKQLAVLLVAQIAMLLLARRLRLSFTAALLAALGYSLCSWLQCWIMHPHAGVAAFLPLLCWAFVGLRETGSARALAVSAIVLALSILAGHVETTALVGVGAAAFAFFLPRGTFAGARLAFFGRTMLVVVLGFAASAVMLVPFFDYLAESGILAHRQKMEGASDIFVISAWEHLLTLFDPDILGSHLSAKEYRGEVSFIETGFFVGSAVLLLAVLGGAFGLKQRRGLVVACGLTAVLGFLCSYDVPVMKDVASFLPGFAEMPRRRFVLIAAVPLALLAGLGLDCLRLLNGRRPALIVAGCGFLLAAVPFAAQFLVDSELAPHMPLTGWLAWFLPVGVIAFCLGVPGRARLALPLLLVLFVGGEGWWRWHKEIPTQPAHLCPPDSEAIRFLQDCSKTGRVLPLMWSLPPEQLAGFRIKSPRGYDAIFFERYIKAMKRSAAFSNVRMAQSTIGANKGFLDLLGVRWLVSSVPEDRLLLPYQQKYIEVGRKTEFEVELNPGEDADFVFGALGPDTALAGVEVEIRAGDRRILHREEEHGTTARHEEAGLGRLLFEKDRLMKFVSSALPRCHNPRVMSFRSLAREQQVVTIALSITKGGGSVRRYALDVDGKKQVAKKLAGDNGIYERPSAVPYVYWAPNVIQAEDETKTLDWIMGVDFHPGRHTLLSIEDADPESFKPELIPEAVPVAFSRPRAEVIEASVETPADRILVVNESWSAGWRAYVDNREVPVLHANYLMMGVPVKAGRHEVRLVYQPRGWGAAVALTIAAWMICLGLLFRKKRQAPPTVSG